MQRRLRQLLKRVVWQITKRDCLVLNPEWQVQLRLGDWCVLSTRQTDRYLPIQYNYHTSKKWHLRYEIRGCESGDMRFSLGTPNKELFCSAELKVQLPCVLDIRLDDVGITANGCPLTLEDGASIPRETTWLVGTFEFRSKEGTLIRRTGHRVKLDAAKSDANYFNGLVYSAYDQEAAQVPQQVLEVIQRIQPDKGQLLDVGCATGLLVERALAEGYNAEGIDQSAWAIEQATKRTGGRCRLLDFDRASILDFASRYETIVLNSVIEHLKDPAGALRILFQMCKPGGVVYIATLNADSMMHSLMGNDWNGYTDYTHQSPWITADWLTGGGREGRVYAESCETLLCLE